MNPGATALDEKVRLLVVSANLAAISSFVPVINNFPVLEGVSTDDWDFYATVAGIQVGTSQLVGRIPNERFIEIYTTVIDPEIAKWDPKGCLALEDCGLWVGKAMKLVGTGELPAELGPTAFLGQWLIMNLLRRTDFPTETANTMNRLGRFVAHPFVGWWAGCGEVTEP